MAWAYCRTCENALDAPGIRDALIGYIKCENCESADYQVDEYTRISLIDEFCTRHEGMSENLPKWEKKK